MTALDQAIIKAYLRRGGRPTPDETESLESVRPSVTPWESHPVDPPPQNQPGVHRPDVGMMRPASIPFDALEPASGISVRLAEPIEKPGANILAGRSDPSQPRPAPVAADISIAPPLVARPSDKTLEPRLRVEAIAWPRPSRRLRRAAGQQIGRLADAVQTAAASGRKLIGLAGFAHGEGCTTVLLAVAIRLAELGRKTLLFDGDTVQPELVEQLALVNDVGWRDVVLGTVHLEDVITQSDSESVALLPYRGQNTPTDTPEPSSQAVVTLFSRIRAHYDVVLVDLGGALTNGGTLAERLAEQMDSIFTVHNVQTTSPNRLDMFRMRLRRIGVQESGVIENFVDDGAA